jgi:hypothetical protein
MLAVHLGTNDVVNAVRTNRRNRTAEKNEQAERSPFQEHGQIIIRGRLPWQVR